MRAAQEVRRLSYLGARGAGLASRQLVDRDPRAQREDPRPLRGVAVRVETGQGLGEPRDALGRRCGIVRDAQRVDDDQRDVHRPIRHRGDDRVADRPRVVAAIGVGHRPREHGARGGPRSNRRETSRPVESPVAEADRAGDLAGLPADLGRGAEHLHQLRRVRRVAARSERGGDLALCAVEVAAPREHPTEHGATGGDGRPRRAHLLADLDALQHAGLRARLIAGAQLHLRHVTQEQRLVDARPARLEERPSLRLERARGGDVAEAVVAEDERDQHALGVADRSAAVELVEHRREGLDRLGGTPPLEQQSTDVRTRELGQLRTRQGLAELRRLLVRTDRLVDPTELHQRVGQRHHRRSPLASRRLRVEQGERFTRRVDRFVEPVQSAQQHRPGGQQEAADA